MTTTRNSQRYPYTYACDWIREAGLAQSRSDASQWRRAKAVELGIEDAELARLYADQYIHYYASLEQLQAKRELDFAAMRLEGK